MNSRPERSRVMARTYSLWDTKIGSRIDRFASEQEALLFVRTMIATYPREKLTDLSLTWRDDVGNVGEERAGTDLLADAEGVATHRVPVGIGDSAPESASGSSSSSDFGPGRWPMGASSPNRRGR